MAFDVTNPADLLTLKTEVADDPLSMGYNPDVSTQQLLNQLNDGDKNVGGETTGDKLTASLLLDAIVANPDDMTIGGQFTQGESDAIKMVLGATSLGENIERYRAQITGMFAANDDLRLQLEAQLRLLSRAEVLFGEGTNISRTDWITARES